MKIWQQNWYFIVFLRKVAFKCTNEVAYQTNCFVVINRKNMAHMFFSFTLIWYTIYEKLPCDVEKASLSSTERNNVFYEFLPNFKSQHC